MADQPTVVTHRQASDGLYRKTQRITLLSVTITFRTDPDSEEALAELTATGQNKTEAIKAALIMAARLQRQERIRAEAAALAADPVDVAEIRSVREEMDALHAW